MDASPRIGFVFFRATDACAADPSLFTKVRDKFHEQWGSFVEAQYWGRAIERPGRFYWIVFWNTPEAYAKFKGDFKEEGVLPESQKHFASLQLEHTPFLDLTFRTPLRPILASPICEVACNRFREEFGSDDIAEKVQQVVDMHANYKGYRGSSWASTPERGGEAVYIAGWDSIEDHMALGVDDEEYNVKVETVIAALSNIQMFHVHFEQH